MLDLVKVGNCNTLAQLQLTEGCVQSSFFYAVLLCCPFAYPPDPSLGSPVQHISDRQPRTTEALQAISRTALSVRQQVSQESQQQALADEEDTQPSTSTQTAAAQFVGQQGGPVEQVSQQQLQQTRQDCFELMSDVMTRVASSSLTQVAPAHVPVLHMIGAVMAPVVHTLLQQRNVLVHQRDELHQEVGQLQSRLKSVQQEVHDVRKQQLSDASFPPLAAIALAQLSQQMHGSGQSLAAGYSNARAVLAGGLLSPVSSPRQPVDTPQRQQLQRTRTAGSQEADTGR